MPTIATKDGAKILLQGLGLGTAAGVEPLVALNADS